jgi:hypothetical protein
MAQNDPLVNCPRGCGTVIAKSVRDSGKPRTATRIDPETQELETYTCE